MSEPPFPPPLGPAAPDHGATSTAPRPPSVEPSTRPPDGGCRDAGLWTMLAGGVAVLVTMLQIVQSAAAFDFAARYMSAAPGSYVSLTFYYTMAVLTPLALLLSYIATCIWLYRARRNAVVIRPDAHHVRQIGWVWFCWLVPVVSFWFPYQIVRDVLHALRPRKGSRAVLGLWWAAFLTYLVYADITGRVDLTSGLSNETAAWVFAATEAVSAMLCVGALVPWLLIIRAIRSDQKAAATERGWIGLAGHTHRPPQDVWSVLPAQRSPVPPSLEAGGDRPLSSTAPTVSTTSASPSSKAMAIWSLVLALVPVPLTWLVAIGLAFTVLLRSKVGRGYAVAALVIAPVWILLSAALLVGSLVGGPEPSAPAAAPRPDGQVAQPKEAVQPKVVSVWSLKEGDCLPKGIPEGTVQQVKVAPCNQPHREEIYAKFNLAPGAFPGRHNVIQRAEDGCLKRFESFVGIDYKFSDLDFFYLFPVAALWPEDRSVVCSVVGTSPNTGTLKGARR